MIFDDFDSNVSGENKTPIARNVTAPRNRVIQAIVSCVFELQELGLLVGGECKLRRREEEIEEKKSTPK